MQNAECRIQRGKTRPGAVPFPRSESCALHSPAWCSQNRSSERGFTLASLLVILTIIAVLLAYTVPRMWSDAMKRERDIQTAWVVKQYARAIAEFQRKRGALPASLDQLKEQNTPRIIRQLYPNPLTGEVDWVLLPPTTVSPIQTPGAPGVPRPPQIPQGAGPSGATGATGTGLTGDYKGPFIGVRPPNTGKAYVSINGSDRYEEWIYTINDLQMELTQRLGGGAAGQPNVGTLPPRPGPSPPKP